MLVIYIKRATDGTLRIITLYFLLQSLANHGTYPCEPNYEMSRLNNILFQLLHGKNSCKAQLFLTTNDLAKEFNNKAQVDMAILDFSKVFDKVSHTRLKHNFDYFGIWGNLLRWL